MLTPILLCLGLALSAHADDRVFDASPAVTTIQTSDTDAAGSATSPVQIDARLAQRLALASGSQVRVVSESEAVSAAAARGVRLEPWGHPWVIVKAGLGMPGNIQADIEIYVHRNWAVEASAGTGLLGGWYTASVRWHPDATTWNWFGVDARTGEVTHENSLQLSLAAELGYTPPNVGWGNQHAAMFLVPNIEAAYIHRFAERFGMTIGGRVGVGPAFDFINGGTQTGLAMTMLLYTGLVF
jgi:hypothetical protein